MKDTLAQRNLSGFLGDCVCSWGWLHLNGVPVLSSQWGHQQTCLLHGSSRSRGAPHSCRSNHRARWRSTTFSLPSQNSEQLTTHGLNRQVGAAPRHQGLCLLDNWVPVKCALVTGMGIWLILHPTITGQPTS